MIVGTINKPAFVSAEFPKADSRLNPGRTKSSDNTFCKATAWGFAETPVTSKCWMSSKCPNKEFNWP